MEDLTIGSEKSSSQKARRNEEITARKVRLIDAEDNMLGIVSTREAIEKARAVSLDLVEVSPNADPPVCRMMDYGKYLFERKKKFKKQTVTQVKEVKFRPGTEEGDYQVKLRNLIRFLEKGDKVKVTLRFKGREMAHQELGLELLNRLKDDIVEFGTVEHHPKREGRQMIMVVGPKRK